MKFPPLSQSERKPTVVDVARAADVAVGTVSRVLNMPELVGPDIRQRVLDAVARLNYRPLRRRRRPGKRSAPGERNNIAVLTLGPPDELPELDRAALSAVQEAAAASVSENLLHAQLGATSAEAPVFLNRSLVDALLLCAPAGRTWGELVPAAALRDLLASLPAVWLGRKPDGAGGDLIAAASSYSHPGHTAADAGGAAALDAAAFGHLAIDLLRWRLAHLDEPVNLTWLIEPRSDLR